MPIGTEELDNWFVYHAPLASEIAQYAEIRDAAKVFAAVLLKNCPQSADLTAAIRKVREAVMTANASIACRGK